MHQDIVDIRTFYDSELGHTTQHLLCAHMKEMWPNAAGETLVGLGYANPFLKNWDAHATRVLSFMPAAQGVISWPTKNANRASLIIDNMLPLADGAVDKMLIVHCLEMTTQPIDLLHDVWRTLAPGSKILLVVPSRLGIWARFEATPFGFGRPFSRTQLAALLRQSGFTANHWRTALYRPPILRRWIPGSAATWERLARYIRPTFGGLLMVEAIKDYHQGIPLRPHKYRSPILRPVMAPQTGAFSGHRR